MTSYINNQIEKSLKLKQDLFSSNETKQLIQEVSDEIIKVANSSYKNGEIDFFQYILSLENATTIQVEYLDAVIQYNKTQLDLQYINL